ncbi:MAG: ImmA/IrrE family metallo-endopeptidase [Saprospiraceae bacterium]|nr:ImmA/IrrE family metallo-endopeptidase [Saprospiraceae bacterium]
MIQRDPIAIMNARQMLSKYNITRPAEYTIEEILNAENIILEEKELDGLAGFILYNNGTGIVTVDKKIKENGKKNFVAAHELGHFVNDKDSIKFCTMDDILSFASIDKSEKRANDFASEFLMPKTIFSEYIVGNKISPLFLNELSNSFQVSISASAIRYVELTDEPTALIMSKNGFVSWSVINDYFPYQYVEKGQRVNKLSYAFDYAERIKNNINYSDLPEEDKVPTEAWFAGDFNFTGDNEEIMEFNIPMKSYGAVLTLLVG